MRYGIAFLLMVIMVGGMVLAQDSPPQVDIVLQDLNTRLGTQLTLEGLDNWTWAEQIYGDTSLGCPQEGQVYNQVTTRGYQVIFEHEGVAYDYRIATDGSFFVFCGSTGEAQATAEVTSVPVTTPVPAATLPAQDAAACPGGLPLRLAVGDTARVTAGLPSNLRAEPALESADLGDAVAGETFTVLAGPVCGNDILWWQVQTASATGWIAQGQNGLYFVEPIPQLLPATDTVFDTENIGQLSLLTEIQSNFAGEMAWTPDGTALAVVYANPIAPGIWWYALDTLDTALPTLLETEFFATALEFSPDGTLLAVGYENGTVEFFDAATRDSLFSTEAHTGAVRDLRFNPAGTVLASIGENNAVRLWGIPQ